MSSPGTPKSRKKKQNKDPDPLITRRTIFELLGGTAATGAGFLYGSMSHSSDIQQTSTLPRGGTWELTHENFTGREEYRIQLDQVLAEDAIRISYNTQNRETQSLIVDSGGRSLDEYASIVLEDTADPINNVATLRFEYNQNIDLF